MSELKPNEKFVDLVHEVLNTAYSLRLVKDYSLVISGTTQVFDLAQPKDSVYVLIIQRNKVTERNKTIQQIERHANLIASTKRTKSRLFVVFAKKLAKIDKIFYKETLKDNPRIQFIILDFIDINNIAVKNGIESEEKVVAIKELVDKNISKESSNKLSRLRQDLILDFDAIFEYLYEKYLEDNSFKFLLRQKGSTRSKKEVLKFDQWFEGADRIIVDFHDVTDQKNKTQNLSFVVNYSNSPQSLSFYVEFFCPADIDKKILDCYVEILTLFDIEYEPTIERYTIALQENNWRDALGNYIVSYKSLMDHVIQKEGLISRFEISDTKFKRMVDKILTIREELFGRNEPVEGRGKGGYPPNNNNDNDALLGDKEFNEKSFSLSGDIPPVLGVKALASEIIELFNHFSVNEKGKIFGVFGNWGRGKTYLAEQIFEQLDGNEGYIKIKFHPWKYQDTPASWAYLYEAFSARYYKVDDETGNYFEKLNKFIKNKMTQFDRSYRHSQVRDGMGPFFLMDVYLFIFLFLAIIFASEVFSILLYGEGILNDLFTWISGAGSILLGIPVVKYLRGIYSNTKTEAVNIFKKYYSKKSFNHVLGTQAEIERELKSLLEAWIPNKDKTKILLFVDDIDRCSEDRIIEIIDALRVMLEDDEITKRVIVIAAIDERVLRRAIQWKYNKLIEIDHDLKDCDKCVEVKRKKEKAEELVLEYMDKLFIAGIKLGILTNDDKLEVLKKYHEKAFEEAEAIQNEVKNEEDDNNDVQDEQKPVDQDLENATSKSQSGGDNEVVPEEKQTNSKPSNEEYQRLENNIKNYTNATPRQIRIYYYRYLLGRKILLDSIEDNSKEYKERALEIFANLLFEFTQEKLIVSEFLTYFNQPNLQELDGTNKKHQSFLVINNKLSGLSDNISKQVLAVIEMVKAY